MSRPSPSLALAAVLSALALAPAEAQVDAAAIWADWQAGAARAERSLSADVTETGDGLILENFATRTVSGDMETSARIDRIALIERDDGTLGVEVSNPYTLTLTFPGEDDEELSTVTLLLTHEGLDLTIAGPPEARSYSYVADVITLEEGEITGEGGPSMVDLEIVARDLETVLDLSGTPDADRLFETRGTTGSLTGRFEAEPPEGEEGRVAVTFALGEIVTEGSGTQTALGAMQEAATGLPEGAEVTGRVSYAFSQLEVLARTPDGDVDASFANQGGTLGFSMSHDRMSYDVSATEPRLEVSGSEIPVPVAISAASSALTLSAPVAASDTAERAELRIDYRDVSLGEPLWAMIDPSGQVPRDPLTLILEATAQVRLLQDLMTDAPMMAETPPGEIEALTVSEFELAFGDASLTGTADLTFVPGEPVPRPVGEAELVLTGGNALLDVLEGAGFLTREQAAVARGVAGMFTRPGPRRDTLETTLEFLEDGTITANGLALQ